MSFQDFQKNRRKFSGQEIRLLLIVVAGSAILLWVLSAATVFLADNLSGGGEFYLLHKGGRAFLFERIEPYSANVPSAVQEKIYGRPAEPGEDVFILDIPFHLFLLYLPLSVIPDPILARALWMGISAIALLFFLGISKRLSGLESPPVFSVLFYLLGFTSYYTFQAFVEGSPAILLGLLYVGILWTIRDQLDEHAGVLLVLAGFRWEAGGPFLLFMLVSAIWARRWRVLIGVAMMAFVLLTASLLWYPGWIFPFLRATWNSLLADFGYSTTQIFSGLWPGFGNTLSWALAGILVVAMGYEWTTSRGTDFQRFVWVASLSIAVAPLLWFRSELDNLVVLLFPLTLIVSNVRMHWKAKGNWIAAGLLLLFTGLPWLVHFRGDFVLGGGVEASLYLGFPLLAVLGLYWIRWWMRGVPRTWLEGVAKLEQR